MDIITPATTLYKEYGIITVTDEQQEQLMICFPVMPDNPMKKLSEVLPDGTWVQLIFDWDYKAMEIRHD